MNNGYILLSAGVVFFSAVLLAVRCTELQIPNGSDKPKPTSKPRTFGLWMFTWAVFLFSIVIFAHYLGATYRPWNVGWELIERRLEPNLEQPVDAEVSQFEIVE